MVWVFLFENKSHFTESNFQEISSEEIFQHFTVQYKLRMINLNMFSKISNEMLMKIFADYVLHNVVDLFNIYDVIILKITHINKREQNQHLCS